MYVYDEYRGYGLSNILLKDAIEKYNANNLGVYSDNEVSIKLYEKFGFKKTKEKEYKDGDKVIFMSLDNKSIKHENYIIEMVKSITYLKSFRDVKI